MSLVVCVKADPRGSGARVINSQLTVATASEASGRRAAFYDDVFVLKHRAASVADAEVTTALRFRTITLRVQCQLWRSFK